MSKNNGFTKEQLNLINGLVDKKICLSKGEARRLVMCMPENIIKDKINRTHRYKVTSNKDT